MKVYYNNKYAGGREESRRLLKRAISEYIGDCARAEQLVSKLKTGPLGKPYIEGFDHFSVSHTGSVWAVLFDVRECGLDIQIEKRCDAEAIARRLYAPDDAEWISVLAAGETGDRAADEFFRLWTRREALAKALGISVYDSGLPSVSADNVSVDLRPYILTNIDLPDIEAVDGKKLYGSVCAEDISGIAGNTLEFEAF